MAFHMRSILLGNFFALPSCIAFLGPPSPPLRPPSDSVTASCYPNIPVPIPAPAADLDAIEADCPPDPYPLLVTFVYIDSSFYVRPAGCAPSYRFSSGLLNCSLEILYIWSIAVPWSALYLACLAISFYWRLACSLASFSLINYCCLKTRSSVESISR